MNSALKVKYQLKVRNAVYSSLQWCPEIMHATCPIINLKQDETFAHSGKIKASVTQNIQSCQKKKVPKSLRPLRLNWFPVIETKMWSPIRSSTARTQVTSLFGFSWRLNCHFFPTVEATPSSVLSFFSAELDSMGVDPLLICFDSDGEQHSQQVNNSLLFDWRVLWLKIMCEQLCPNLTLQADLHIPSLASPEAFLSSLLGFTTITPYPSLLWITLFSIVMEGIISRWSMNSCTQQTCYKNVYFLVYFLVKAFFPRGFFKSGHTLIRTPSLQWWMPLPIKVHTLPG